MTAVIAIMSFGLGWAVAWRYRGAVDTERLMTYLHDLNWYRSAYRKLQHEIEQTEDN